MSDEYKNATFAMLLKWLRTDDSPYTEGFTAGYLCAIERQLDAWQVAYLHNIKYARFRGIPA